MKNENEKNESETLGEINYIIDSSTISKDSTSKKSKIKNNIYLMSQKNDIMNKNNQKKYERNKYNNIFKIPSSEKNTIDNGIKKDINFEKYFNKNRTFGKNFSNAKIPKQNKNHINNSCSNFSHKNKPNKNSNTNEYSINDNNILNYFTQRNKKNDSDVGNRLYNMHQVIISNINKKKMELEKKEMENCSFVPKIDKKSRKIMEKYRRLVSQNNQEQKDKYDIHFLGNFKIKKEEELNNYNYINNFFRKNNSKVSKNDKLKNNKIRKFGNVKKI